jgi:eukaryotic-like serine/threonine-protein kinase
VVYELPAIKTKNTRQLMHLIEHEQPKLPRAIDSEIPKDLETIILKAIDKGPTRRYATADEMADDLLAFREDREIRGRRARWDEKIVRSCRRNPAVAALSAAFLLALMSVAVLSLLYAYQNAKTAAQIAMLARGLELEGENLRKERTSLKEALIQSKRRQAILNVERGWTSSNSG